MLANSQNHGPFSNTQRSVLLVGLFHAAHNTTINRFAAEFIPGPAGTGFLITEGVVVAAAVLVLVFTRGRLSYTPNQEIDERRC